MSDRQDSQLLQLIEQMDEMAAEKRAAVAAGAHKDKVKAEFEQGLNIGAAVAYELAAKWVREILVEDVTV